MVMDVGRILVKNNRILLKGEKYLYLGKLENEDAYLILSLASAKLKLVDLEALNSAVLLEGV